MVGEVQGRIWLGGKYPTEAYDFDTATGRARYVKTPGSVIGPTAGNGTKFLRTLVATFVGPNGRDIYMQIGTDRFRLDDDGTRVAARQHLIGLWTTLVVERDDDPTRRLHRPTPGRIWSEGLDVLANDVAVGIARLASVVESQEMYRRVHSFHADPGLARHTSR